MQICLSVNGVKSTKSFPLDALRTLALPDVLKEWGIDTGRGRTLCAGKILKDWSKLKLVELLGARVEGQAVQLLFLPNPDYQTSLNSNILISNPKPVSECSISSNPSLAVSPCPVRHEVLTLGRPTDPDQIENGILTVKFHAAKLFVDIKVYEDNFHIGDVFKRVGEMAGLSPNSFHFVSRGKILRFSEDNVSVHSLLPKAPLMAIPNENYWKDTQSMSWIKSALDRVSKIRKEGLACVKLGNRDRANIILTALREELICLELSLSRTSPEDTNDAITNQLKASLDATIRFIDECQRVVH